ncbi:uncharacterized protein SEPMUDRAFT_156001 [Sphaerulina musiva SO2202]|uniref:Uncharacterized protein n=1 Tax=Sphaerulina musiva (strain SO2202) TaxID=692275 RepID=M3B1Y4_SPHMS|nr:uncharacterized protein SEPMUDRAFT_156001 [Sphaerulina musiva SO2202]EMF13802.1 hypothetical protein SEPMUDRAFT_156001 [Sphaerulina musiva SO2202]
MAVFGSIPGHLIHARTMRDCRRARVDSGHRHVTGKTKRHFQPRRHLHALCLCIQDTH